MENMGKTWGQSPIRHLSYLGAVPAATRGQSPRNLGTVPGLLRFLGTI